MRPIDADALSAFVGDLRSALHKEQSKFKGMTDIEFNTRDYMLLNFQQTIDNAPTVEPQKIVTIPPELIEKLASCVVDIVGSIDWEKAIEAYKARPHGEWIKEEDRVHSKCSSCGFKYADYGILFDFCPNCGADMRGGRE